MNTRLLVTLSDALDSSSQCESTTPDGAPTVCQDTLGQPSRGQVEATIANQTGRGFEGEAAVQRRLQARPQQ